MKITIKTLQGHPTEYEVADDMTVDQLKAKIAEEFKADAAAQKLIYSGKVMSEGFKKLVDYGVKDKEFIVLMISKVPIGLIVLRASQLHPLPHPLPHPFPSSRAPSQFPLPLRGPSTLHHRPRRHRFLRRSLRLRWLQAVRQWHRELSRQESRKRRRQCALKSG
jgi:UV excision repair protein RAD23